MGCHLVYFPDRKLRILRLAMSRENAVNKLQSRRKQKTAVQLRSFEQYVRYPLDETARFEELFLRFIPQGPELHFSFLNKSKDVYFTVKVDISTNEASVILPNDVVITKASLNGLLTVGEEGSMRFRAGRYDHFSIAINDQIVASPTSLMFGDLKDIKSCQCSTQTVQILEAIPQIVEDNVL